LKVSLQGPAVDAGEGCVDVIDPQLAIFQQQLHGRCLPGVQPMPDALDRPVEGGAVAVVELTDREQALDVERKMADETLAGELEEWPEF
jgi:hypothetical protein